MTMELRFAWVGFFAFLLFLFFAVLKRTKRISERLVICFPILFSLFGAIQSFVPEKYLPFAQFIPGELKNYRMTEAAYSFEPVTDIIFVTVILCVLYTIWILMRNRKEFLISAAVLAFGLGTRVLMGFSPRCGRPDTERFLLCSSRSLSF